MDADRALVVTTDFFTPVVDDPFDYGMISAANSLSDVYAMGGVPFLALNIAALPPDLPTDVSAEILRGGAAKAIEAGVAVAGGHTIQDKEPKYGLVVLGFVHPERMLRKSGVQLGDVLFITKPLGFGVTTTALKQEKASKDDVSEAIDWMKRLNRQASALAFKQGLRAATDITGFGFLGHAMEMAESSKVRLRISLKEMPFVTGARKYAEMWAFPGGASDNFLYFGERVIFGGSITKEEQMLLSDPQTSGGLLLACPPEKRETIIKEANDSDMPLWQIGEAVEGDGIEVV